MNNSSRKVFVFLFCLGAAAPVFGAANDLNEIVLGLKREKWKSDHAKAFQQAEAASNEAKRLGAEHLQAHGEMVLINNREVKKEIVAVLEKELETTQVQATLAYESAHEKWAKVHKLKAELELIPVPQASHSYNLVGAVAFGSLLCVGVLYRSQILGYLSSWKQVSA